MSISLPEHPPDRPGHHRPGRHLSHPADAALAPAWSRGVSPAKRPVGRSVPVFNTVREASKNRRECTVIFVPARFTAASDYEAMEAVCTLIITVAEHVRSTIMLASYQPGAKLGCRVIGLFVRRHLAR